MKKFLALIAFTAFISLSASAQTSAQTDKTKPAPAATSTTGTSEVKTDVKEKSCHDASARKGASCCQKKAEASNGKKASCGVPSEEKAEAKEEKAKGLKD